MPNSVLDNGMLHCSHLSMEDKQDIENFTVHSKEGEGLVNYIQRFAFQEEATKRMRTYIVRDIVFAP